MTSSPSMAAGAAEVLVTDANDGQDGASAIRLDDRVETRVKPRADDRVDAGDGEVLEVGIRQVDHLRHEVAAEKPDRSLRW